MSSFRKCVEVKKCILELLIRNENVIDGQADRQTDMCKAICHSSKVSLLQYCVTWVI